MIKLNYVRGSNKKTERKRKFVESHMVTSVYYKFTNRMNPTINFIHFQMAMTIFYSLSFVFNSALLEDRGNELSSAITSKSIFLNKPFYRSKWRLNLLWWSEQIEDGHVGRQSIPQSSQFAHNRYWTNNKTLSEERQWFYLMSSASCCGRD